MPAIRYQGPSWAKAAFSGSRKLAVAVVVTEGAVTRRSTVSRRCLSRCRDHEVLRSSSGRRTRSRQHRSRWPQAGMNPTQHRCSRPNSTFLHLTLACASPLRVQARWASGVPTPPRRWRVSAQRPGESGPTECARQSWVRREGLKPCMQVTHLAEHHRRLSCRRRRAMEL